MLRRIILYRASKNKNINMLNSFSFVNIRFAFLCIISRGCKKTESVTSSGSSTVPAVYSKIYGATSITSDGTYIITKSNHLPDYKSVYYPTTDSMYQSFSGITFNGYTFSKNPNKIELQTLTFKIPLNPQVATTHSATPLGPVGISLNGVPFYNQYAGSNLPLTNEAGGFDQYWGHPQQTGKYHYHVEPLYLTTVKATKSSLLGFLLDGFPVYGPEENGVTITNAMMDEYHGHTTATPEYPNGIYHYHISGTDPYINGSGFYGTPGTVSQ
jgi:hypothetical protein